MALYALMILCIWNFDHFRWNDGNFYQTHTVRKIMREQRHKANYYLLRAVPGIVCPQTLSHWLRLTM